MYGTHQTFAHRWSDEVVASRGPKTGFRTLPNRKSIRKK